MSVEILIQSTVAERIARFTDLTAEKIFEQSADCTRGQGEVFKQSVALKEDIENDGIGGTVCFK